MQQSSAVEIFCCYARKDMQHLDKLKTHLSPFQRQNVIHIWDDGDLRAGTEWDQEIKKHLNEAQIILLFVSPDFIASDYCYRTEMKQALERHKQGEARVIPIILRPIAGWKQLSFGDIQLGQLQALPTNARAITSWADSDSAWKEVAEGIVKVAGELLKNHPVSTRHSENTGTVSFDDSSIEQLIEALLNAFPTTTDLKLLISYKLRQNIEVIAAGNNLEERMHSLVTWAYSQGRIEELITGALARNPGNPKLRKFAGEHGF